ncbi:uncharacterized protein LTR77_000607 [Saxophila tyrrhenica]|uniref:Uncharacterized protein n=1 Tax=Saxophila tyrrhenica TaxID=1690608 RepID=A0AAV9PSZ9_9PEZI|nr:hypothetical protein LTR77_000607 [Saxophila tyrrhenica]
MSSDGTQGSKDKHLPYAVVPLIAILGAAAFTMLCYVFYRHMHGAGDELREISDEQAVYMREVRQRNKDDIEALTGYYKNRRGSGRYW